MIVLTQDLIGTPLDWAVAKADGELDANVKVGRATAKAVVYDQESATMFSMRNGRDYLPSIVWNQIGPILFSAKIHSLPPQKGVRDDWAAYTHKGSVLQHESHGDTPMVAIARCFVASRLGAEVDVPDEIVAAAENLARQRCQHIGSQPCTG